MFWHEDLHCGKHLPAIIDLARKATAVRPDIVKNWYMLASLLIQAGEDEQAITVLTEAISKLPPDPTLYEMLAGAKHQSPRVDLLRDVLQCAPAIPIDDRETTISHFELLMKSRIADDESQVATNTLALDPLNSHALSVLGRVSRNNGRPQIMVPFCRAALERDPGHTRARFELAVAFAMLGRSEEARQLIDLDRFIEVIDLAPPESYATAERFENALTSEIAGNPTLKLDPVDKAIKGGFQTSGLPQPSDRAISAVLDLIRLAVDGFEVNLLEGLKDPFVTERPKQAWLHAWAVVYPGDGRQMSHIHDDGWLSGVYYVSVPKTSSGDPRAGCLLLGSLEHNGPSVDPPWGTRDIRPVPGRLVLFPSYIPHATIPTRSTDQRICISFDVIPTHRGSRSKKGAAPLSG
jgi:Putative 2OG-Fe(II) oxygenase/Tetratricopeptide repeat